jgi:hypothetical protein
LPRHRQRRDRGSTVPRKAAPMRVAAVRVRPCGRDRACAQR